MSPCPGFGRVPSWIVPPAAELDGRRRSVPGALAEASGAAAKLYLALGAHANGQGECVVGTARLAIIAGLSRSAVFRAIHELTTLGMVSRISRPGRSLANRYKIIMDPPDTTINSVTGDTILSENGVTSETVSPAKRCHLSDKTVSPERLNGVTRATQGIEQSYNRVRTEHKARDAWDLALQVMTSDALRTAAFQAAWLEWVEYRHEQRKKLTPRTIHLQIRKLEGFGLDGAIASLEQSMTNGWTGLFEPRGERKLGQTPATPPPPADYSIYRRIKAKRDAAELARQAKGVF